MIIIIKIVSENSESSPQFSKINKCRVALLCSIPSPNTLLFELKMASYLPTSSPPKKENLILKLSFSFVCVCVNLESSSGQQNCTGDDIASSNAKSYHPPQINRQIIYRQSHGSNLLPPKISPHKSIIGENPQTQTLYQQWQQQQQKRIKIVSVGSKMISINK